MQLGIVGMPFVGKTTLFNALTRAHAETGSYSSSSKDPNRAAVRVGDPRLDALYTAFQPKKKTHTMIEYIDMAGLTRGSIEQGGMTPQFFASLRTVGALVHVVRAFEDDAVPHVHDTLDPRRDADSLEFEFAIADLQIVENRLERLVKETRTTKNAALIHEQAVLEQCREALSKGLPIRNLALTPEDSRLIKGFRFLTQKPLLVVVNVGEYTLQDGAALAKATEPFDDAGIAAAALCAKIEMELSQLSDDEAAAFREDLGIVEPALTKMVHMSYQLLGMLTFFTAGETEVRAWTLPAGSTALDAAGSIHTDLARGFIRAETVPWQDLSAHGSYPKVREAGLLRLEGKEYRVQDGDVLLIRFNV
ncbi:redox-regulated ATPase YchF [Candidatus Poribacteria bacterium]|nr:redox-regulated ATPase YchF [Candidatus Poribacteria bacterium]